MTTKETKIDRGMTFPVPDSIAVEIRKYARAAGGMTVLKEHVASACFNGIGLKEVREIAKQMALADFEAIESGE